MRFTRESRRDWEKLGGMGAARAEMGGVIAVGGVGAVRVVGVVRVVGGVGGDENKRVSLWGTHSFYNNEKSLNFF